MNIPALIAPAMLSLLARPGFVPETAEDPPVHPGAGQGTGNAQARLRTPLSPDETGPATGAARFRQAFGGDIVEVGLGNIDAVRDAVQLTARGSFPDVLKLGMGVRAPLDDTFHRLFLRILQESDLPQEGADAIPGDDRDQAGASPFSAETTRGAAAGNAPTPARQRVFHAILPAGISTSTGFPQGGAISSVGGNPRQGSGGSLAEDPSHTGLPRAAAVYERADIAFNPYSGLIVDMRDHNGEIARSRGQDTVPEDDKIFQEEKDSLVKKLKVLELLLASSEKVHAWLKGSLASAREATPEPAEPATRRDLLGEFVGLTSAVHDGDDIDETVSLLLRRDVVFSQLERSGDLPDPETAAHCLVVERRITAMLEEERRNVFLAMKALHRRMVLKPTYHHKFPLMSGVMVRSA